MVFGSALGKFILILILVLGAFSLGRSIWRNLGGTHRVGRLREELAAAQRRNEGLKNDLAEKEGLAFVEKEAREKLGMVKAGEKVVVIPKEGGAVSSVGITNVTPRVYYWREWLRVFRF